MKTDSRPLEFLESVCSAAVRARCESGAGVGAWAEGPRPGCAPARSFAGRVLLLALLAVPAYAQNLAPTFDLRPANTQSPLFTNGSFETGNLTGWVTNDTANASSSLAVRNSPSNLGFFTGSATDGSKFAYHPFSGTSGVNPGSISLAQDLVLPTGVPGAVVTLTFAFRAAWIVGSSATDPRLFRVAVQPSGGGADSYSTNLVSTVTRRIIMTRRTAT